MMNIMSERRYTVYENATTVQDQKGDIAVFGELLKITQV